jgi:hypothetical protein
MDNTVLIVGLLVIVAGAGFTAYNFIKKTNEKRIEAISEWLKYAVTVAESAMQSGTGALKLQYVWSMETAQFPWITKLITFAQFSKMVDEALVWMKDQIQKNPNIAGIIIGKVTEVINEEEQ